MGHTAGLAIISDPIISGKRILNKAVVLKTGIKYAKIMNLSNQNPNQAPKQKREINKENYK